MVSFGGPNFLSGNTPFLTIASCFGLEASQVATCSGFREELTPRVGAVKNRGNVSVYLVLVTVGKNRRGGKHHSEACR